MTMYADGSVLLVEREKDEFGAMERALGQIQGKRLLGAVIGATITMYAAVASYMCQAWRIFDLELKHFPSYRLSILLCVAIYANFFTNASRSAGSSPG